MCSNAATRSTLLDDHQPRFPTSQTTIRAGYGVGEPGASLVNGWEIMSAGEQYLSSVVKVIERIADTQLTTKQLVGTLVGRSVVQGGIVHLWM